MVMYFTNSLEGKLDRTRGQLRGESMLSKANATFKEFLSK